MLERMRIMKRTVLILFMAAVAAAASAQTSSKPAAPAARPAARTAAAAAKLPPGVPPVKGIVKTAFSLKYEEIKVGAGAEAAPNKVYKVQYTGWLAADGHKFDSSYDHRAPVLDKDGKPVMGEDGKPKLGDPQPFVFPQGFGRLIAGWDDGFYGMRIGGKRRLFIPWQMAYGANGRPGPDAAHPGIPPKADLIFDIELLEVTDLPTQPNRPGLGGMHPMPGGIAPHPGMTIPLAHAPATPAVPAKPAQPVAPAAPANPAAPATPAQPQSK
jgi:peptidylprolyl isomerase